MTVPLKLTRKFLFTFVFSLACVVGVTALIINNMTQLERIKMERIILHQSNKLSSVLSKLLYKTQALSALVVQHNGQIDNFDKVAAILMDDPAIMNVIAAKDGVVSHVYPLKGNEAVLGLDYFSEGAGNKEALLARDKGAMVMGGPFSMVQGGSAIVGRLPVYLKVTDEKQRLWGIVSVTLRFPQALDGAELNKLAEMGLAYELWRVSPETGESQRIAGADYDYNPSAPYVEMPLRILNAEWFFRLSPIRLWYEYVETWVCIGLGVLLSLLMAFLVQQNSDLNGMKQQLESIAVQDPLTGILNRRGSLAELSELVDNHKDFLLFFFDMDGFKHINDKHGHGVGDAALRIFVQTVQNHISLPYTFGRLGGDEFMLAVCGTEYRKQVENALNEVAEILQANKLRGQAVPVKFSLGVVAYPENAETVDALLAQADEEMYVDKRRKKKPC